jgi:hypothetical protein
LAELGKSAAAHPGAGAIDRRAGRLRYENLYFRIQSDTR